MGKKYFKLFIMFFMTILIPFYTCLNLYGAEEILPDAEEIIRKYLEAICGKDACKNIRNQKIETTVIMVENGFNIKTTTYEEKPDRELTIIDMGRINKIIFGTDGKIAWRIDRKEGARIFEGKELAEVLLDTSFEEEPDHWKKMYKSVKTISIEDVNGRDCYKVVFTPYTGFQRIRYYDTESYFMLKEEKNTIDKSNFKEEFYFEDYEDYDGFLRAKTVKRHINGKPGLLTITTVNRIKNNIEMPEGIFDPPKEIKALIKKKQR